MQIFNYFLGLVLVGVIGFVMFEKVLVIKLVGDSQNSKPNQITTLYDTAPKPISKAIKEPIKKTVKKKFKVVIVSGHVADRRKASKQDGRGAKSAGGVYEYRFNDNISSWFKQKKYQLENVEYQVILATQNVSLKERVNFTNKILKPDLYIEIHHDSALLRDIKRAKREGADGKMWRLISGFSMHVSSQNRFYKENLKFAKILSNQFLNKNFKPNLYHSTTNRFPLIDKKRGIYNRIKPYGLYILYHLKNPTVLLECATIINSKDEKMVNSPQNQIKMVNAINNAIKIYIKTKK